MKSRLSTRIIAYMMTFIRVISSLAQTRRIPILFPQYVDVKTPEVKPLPGKLGYNNCEIGIEVIE